MQAILPVSLLLTTLAAFAVNAADLRSAGDIATKLTTAGYTEVREIEFDDGLWEAEVRRADGRWGEVHIEPVSGVILDAQQTTSLLDAAGIRAALEAAGYSAIDDVDRDGATYDVDATDVRGQRVELRVSGIDGQVLHSDVDWDD